MMLPSRIQRDRVIPVARGLDATSAPEIAAALGEGGIGSIEVTVEGAGGLSAITAVAAGGMLVGAGTVTTIEMADRAVTAGASFVVSPHFDPDLVDWGHAQHVPVIPGALTPTEIANVWLRAPAAVKLFPAHLGGPEYVRSLLGPYPDLILVPTGGVDAGNIAAFLEAGAVAVGVGSWLTGRSDYREVSSRASLLVSAVAAVDSTG